MISSTADLKSFIHSHSIHSFYPPSRFPPWSMVLTQTIADNIDARRCNPSPSPLVLTLLNMHTHSKARIPQVIIIPRHQPFISPFTKLLGQVAGAAEKNFNNQPSSLQANLHTSLSVSHLHAWSIRLDLPSYHPTTTFCPLPALVPSTSPH